MKANSQTVRTVLTLAFCMILTATPGLAQETMLGVHGGAAPFETPGAVSIVNQSNANTIFLDTPPPGVGLTGVATNSAGRVFASTGWNGFADTGPRLLEIDPATGALLNDVGRLQTLAGEDCYVGDLSFQPGTGMLFGVLGNQEDGRCDQEGQTGGVLVTINTATARVTVIGRDASLGNSNGGLAFAPNGTLYFTPCWDTESKLLTLNPATGAILTSRDLELETCYMGLAARPSDGKLFASFNAEGWDSLVVVTLNPSNGDATLVGHTLDSMIHDLTFTDAVSVGFHINAGMNDSWYDQATSGQGFFIIVFEDTGTVFMAWFTYDTERPPTNAAALLGEPGHRWVTAQGPYDGDTAELNVFLTQGGVFDMAQPPAMTGAPIGTIRIVWHDCESATLTYDIDPPGVTGEIEIGRIVPDNVKYCEALQP